MIQIGRTTLVVNDTSNIIRVSTVEKYKKLFGSRVFWFARREMRLFRKNKNAIFDNRIVKKRTAAVMLFAYDIFSNLKAQI